MKRQKNRVNYLTREYRDDHLNSEEMVSPIMKKQINHNYYEKEQLKIVDDVLYVLPSYTATLLKDQVYYIVKHYKLKDLCSTCKIETIMAVIILFVWKDYNKRLIIDKNSLWDSYDLTWKTYAIIIGNLLRKTREESNI